jgi:methionyl-tRNA synthetase
MSKYYITTAIPYVNDQPHLGHAMEYVYADVLARYHRKLGDKVLFSTGTDEHGSKIALKAKELGITPKELTEKNVAGFTKLLKKLDISHDRFIRTTDKAHQQRVQMIWKKLKNDIYKNKYIGLYCVGCEEFVTETAAKAHKNICPIHQKPYEKLEEENYFFALSRYSEAIKTAISSNSFHIIPTTRKNEILSLIDSGLDDISISRPMDKLAWGIKVPGDDKQVIYVWFEALLNYITVLGYPEHGDFAEFWPANMQVIGKDILRFHTAIWPGILLALGQHLPKQLYVHGFVNVDGQKMSKSTGNVIDPNEVIAKYGSDAFRYFFMRHIPSYDDGDFTWELMERAYNNELANELGNAVQRLAVMVGKYQNNIIGAIPPAGHDIHEYQDALEKCRFDKALDEVWEQVRGVNQYIDTEKPWVIAKEGDEPHLREVLAYAVGCLLEIADLLEPFMPNTAHKISFMFKEGIIRPLDGPLFPKEETKKDH